MNPSEEMFLVTTDMLHIERKVIDIVLAVGRAAALDNGWEIISESNQAIDSD